MNQFHIRACEPDDLSTLLDVCAKHAEYEGANYVKEGKREKLEKILFCPNPPLYCLVVVAEGAVVGYASYTFNYSTWEAGFILHMDCLYLEPEWRNFGIGKSMMRTLQEIAKKRSCINMQWQTPEFNKAAIQFYQNLGASSKNKIRFYLEAEPH